MRGARKHTLALRDPEHHVRIVLRPPPSSTSCRAATRISSRLVSRATRSGGCRPCIRVTLSSSTWTGAAVGTETVGDARRLEGSCSRPASRTVPRRRCSFAAGRRRVIPSGTAAPTRCCSGQSLTRQQRPGYALHAPASLAARAAATAGRGLYESTSQLLRAMDSAHAYGETATHWRPNCATCWTPVSAGIWTSRSASRRRRPGLVPTQQRRAARRGGPTFTATPIRYRWRSGRVPARAAHSRRLTW